MLLIGTAGMLAGYLLMWNADFQLAWMAITCHPPFLACCLRHRAHGLTRDPLLRVAAAFLLWNLSVGLLRNHHALAIPYTWDFLAGALMLPVFLGSVWLVCRKEQGPVWITRALMAGGLLAAVVSLIYWRFHQVMEDPGARLRNLLVHGGQHPVSTAMCLAFALVSSAMVYSKTKTRARRAALLGLLAIMMLAVMLTLSRGALLALACVPLGFAAAAGVASLRALARGKPVAPATRPFLNVLRRTWPQITTVLAVAVGFLLYGGHLAPTPAPPENLPPGTVVIHGERLGHSPVIEYLARRSNGRVNFYNYGFAMVNSWDKHLFGAGLWGPEMELQEITARQLGSSGIDHFHSIYIATYIHGGIIGSALFLALLALGVKRAAALVSAGQPQWLALLAFGLGALIMDGQSACSLVTHPRFESFILWFPLVGAAAAWSRIQAGGRQLSSSESK
jgi:hypothetical protein